MRTPTNYNPARLAKAFAHYLPHLDACMREFPDHYAPQVLAKGAAENAQLTFRHVREKGIRSLIINPSPSWKRTCKSLGIKHTYKAIEAWLSETEATDTAVQP